MNKFEYMNKIYSSTRLTRSEKNVLFNLISRANKEMQCFPSVKRIASDCSISTRTVQRALKSLLDSGFLYKENRYHIQGGQRSNLYTILDLDPDEVLDEGTDEDTYEDQDYDLFLEEDIEVAEDNIIEEIQWGVSLEARGQVFDEKDKIDGDLTLFDFIEVEYTKMSGGG